MSLPPWRRSPLDPDFGMQPPADLERTSWWRRFGATVIDVSAAWLVASGAGVLGGPFATIAWMCFVAWNNILLTGTTGASIGRQAMGYQILDDQLFDPIGPGRATGRFFASFIDGVLLGLGYLLPLFNRDRQRVADMVVHSAPFDVDGLTSNARRARTILAVVISIIAAIVIPLRISGGYDQLDRAAEVSSAYSAASAASLRTYVYVQDPTAVGLQQGTKLTDVALWQRWIADAPSHKTMTKQLRVMFYSAAAEQRLGWSGKVEPFAPIELADIARVEFRVGREGVACLRLSPGTDAAGLLNNTIAQEPCDG